MTMMRTASLHCYSCVVIGVFVRTAYSLDSVTPPLFIGDQNAYLVYLGIAQVLLAFGLFVGLINLFGREDSNMPLGIAVPKQLVSQPIALGIFSVFLVFLSFTDLPTLPLLVFAAMIGALGWTGYKQSKTETILRITSIDITKEILQELNSNNRTWKFAVVPCIA